MSEKPVRKALSPWAWAGIGCFALSVLGLGGCVALGLLVKGAIDAPIDPQKSVAALHDANIPVYPGATLDPMRTRLNGKAFSTISVLTGGKAKVTLAAFAVPDAVVIVRRWYGTKLPALGFKEESTQENSALGARVDQVQWGRGKDETLMVQFTTPEPGKKGSVVTLARITGLPKEGRD